MGKRKKKKDNIGDFKTEEILKIFYSELLLSEEQNQSHKRKR